LGQLSREEEAPIPANDLPAAEAVHVAIVSGQRLVPEDPPFKPALTKVGVHPLASVPHKEKISAQACRDFLSLCSVVVPAFDPPGLDLPFVDRSDDHFTAINHQLVERALRIYPCDVIYS
jgi:hypothetical protein